MPIKSRLMTLISSPHFFWVKQWMDFISWLKVGITQFVDLLVHGQMVSWMSIKSRLKELTLSPYNAIKSIIDSMIKKDVIRIKLTKIEEMLQWRTIFKRLSLRSFSLF